ncbi:alpha-E domain-containing protein [Dyadobacter sp. CY326]|uniref:alpha-E domain-containing protein n=1 Tax=Dyadobacter sp. CY326 TaxID=2907300 RepID=UPI001F302202|nr:alpha-E domain-containing protein [Dyadobacter sp. CY326]MCE7067875.1 alpha-E domain-containing protein [Dyadobacter sp. CY326]
MLSRVANSIYWMNRYIERVENYARFVGVNFNLALDLPPDVDEQWEPLLIATADHYLFYKYYEKPTKEDVIHFMTFDKRNPNSIISCLYEARENARTIRETISKEMWESINTFYLSIRSTNPDNFRNMDHMQSYFTEIRKSCQLFHGVVDSSITRNEAWHFGRLGRHIERADKCSRFLDVKYFTLLQDSGPSGSTLDLMLWTAVLKSVSAYNMYRQTHRALTPMNIVAFLILDKLFPRSIAYCVRQAELSLYAIAGSIPERGHTNVAERTLSKIRSELEFTDVEDVFKMGLHQYLDRFQTSNNEVDNAIFDMYFGLETGHSQSQSQGHSQSQSQSQSSGQFKTQWMN